MSILDKTINKVIDDGIRELRKYARDREYHVDYSVKNNNDSVIIQLKIFAHFDVGEACSERLLSKYKNDEEIEITEEEFNECIMDLIEYINIEYGLYNQINIKTKNYEIKTYALECDSDNCSAGGILEIRSNKDINDINHLMHYIKYIIMLFLEL